jgi:hypothetical protein
MLQAILWGLAAFVFVVCVIALMVAGLFSGDIPDEYEEEDFI